MDRMTTYILGAGASFHAGYPLCSELWLRMSVWVIETQPPSSEFRRALDLVATLNGPVGNMESVFTDLDLGQRAFGALTEDERNKMKGRIRRCLRAFFKSLGEGHPRAPLYEAFAKRVAKGDVVVTFNYDTSLEAELVRALRFRVRDGYGFEADWDEQDSDVRVLKPHGSINWIGLLFEGRSHRVNPRNSLGQRPFVDNSDLVLPDYPSCVLDKSFPVGSISDGSTTLVLPTHKKVFSVTTSFGDEWVDFYESLWSRAETSLQQSDRIVMIGYSMPEADSRSRAVLLRSTNKRAEVIICCGASTAALGRQFETHGFWRVRQMGTFESFLGISAQ